MSNGLILEGETFYVTQGEYDDYNVVAVLKARAGINVAEAEAEYGLVLGGGQGTVSGFLNWLTMSKGLAWEVTSLELHVDTHTFDRRSKRYDFGLTLERVDP